MPTKVELFYVLISVRPTGLFLQGWFGNIPFLVGSFLRCHRKILSRRKGTDTGLHGGGHQTGRQLSSSKERSEEYMRSHTVLT